MFIQFNNNVINTTNLSYVNMDYENYSFGKFIVVSFVDNHGNKNRFTLYPSDFENYEYNIDNFMNGFCDCLNTSVNHFNNIKEYLRPC